MIDDFRGESGTEVEIPDADERYLTFWVGERLCGLPIAHVVQIVGMQPITPIPQFPAYAKGVIDLRNQIVPVVDLRLRFQRPQAEYDERTCIVIHQHQSLPVGLVVDKVDRVLEIPESQILPPPDAAQDTDWGFAWGQGNIDDKTVLLMNVYQVMEPADTAAPRK